MTEKSFTGSKPNDKSIIQFSLKGLTVFSVSLFLASALLTYALASLHFNNSDVEGKMLLFGKSKNTNQIADKPVTPLPPWGELLTYDINIERPEEYVPFEANTNKVPAWIFGGMKSEQVRTLMLSSGLSPGQVEHALSPEFALVTSSNTIVKPDDNLIFSLSPEVRAKFYHQLSRFPQNQYMRYPFCFPGTNFDAIFSKSEVDGTIVSLVEKLLYRRGGGQCFSDIEAVLRHIPSETDRLHLVKALSRQNAVLARIHIRRETDIDKLLGYWAMAPGVRLKDVRPLLESLQRLQNGGSISLLYLLPPFARERLYTFPMPPQPGEPTMDCHWSSLNFFNETPDDRLGDMTYASAYVKTNYYEVAKATHYGDIIFVLDEGNDAIHSAVYIAGDIVFTKNGNNFLQPWMLMHLKDLLATYGETDPPRVAVYRNRDW